MNEDTHVSDWEGYAELLLDYFKLPLSQRSRFLFRGHADAGWELETTLDRLVRERGLDMSRRDAFRERLLAEFLHQGALFLEGARFPENPTEAALLSRHHGLPNSILDWTRSPWIAAFFAAEPSVNTDFCVWLFDRQAYSRQVIGDDPIEIIDDPRQLRFNTRAIEQDGVAMMYAGGARSLVEVLGASVSRVICPASERRRFVDMLQAMRITRRALFRSLDSAAISATWRVCEEFAP